MPILTMSVIFLPVAPRRLAGAHRVGECRHGVEHRVDLGHDVVAVDHDALAASAPRSATCSTARSSVMLIFSPANIASRRPSTSAASASAEQQLHRLAGHRAFRPVEQQVAGRRARASRSGRDRRRRRRACRSATPDDRCARSAASSLVKRSYGPRCDPPSDLVELVATIAEPLARLQMSQDDAVGCKSRRRPASVPAHWHKALNYQKIFLAQLVGPAKSGLWCSQNKRARREAPWHSETTRRSGPDFSASRRNPARPCRRRSGRRSSPPFSTARSRPRCRCRPAGCLPRSSAWRAARWCWPSSNWSTRAS